MDIISTDDIGGLWDSIRLVLEKAVEKGVIDLAGAVALATANVAKAIPKLAPNRGLLAPGKVADIVVTKEATLSDVTAIIIGGRIVKK